MLLEERNKMGNLENFTMEMDSDIKEAADLLYEIINHSYVCSGNCIATKIHDQQVHISELYNWCKEKMEQLEKGGRKVSFLAMSIMEDTFKKCLPLLLVPLEELSNGDMSQIKAVEKLKKLFTENPYAAMWTEKSEKYRKVIESLGFSVDASDYQELTAIMDPLLDALTIYQGKTAPKIKQVRPGKTSKSKPEIMTDVCIYHSEKEFTDAIMGCGKDCVIAFGAIAPFNYMITDHMYEYIHGIYDERKRNTMEHEKLTAQEYDMSICDYRRYITLGVKSGEKMWLMKMPYYRGTYSNLSNPDSMYCYGKRAGYAPYQVFFKEPLATEKETTFLPIPKKGYRLCEIMDEMQKVWLPVFLEETINKFFRDMPEAENVIFPEEIIAKSEVYEISPVKMNALTNKVQLVLTVPEPEEIFTDTDNKAIMTLIHHFSITSAHIKNYPVLPNEIGTEEQIRIKYLENIKAAYENEVKKCVQKVLEEQECILKINIANALYDTQAETVAKAALIHALDSFTDVKIDGTIAKATDWNGRIKEEIWHPSKYDYSEIPKSQYIHNYNLCKFNFWYGPKANKPGVILEIRPKTTDDYAALMGCNKEDLPELLRYYDEFKTFMGRMMPQFVNINICMRKQTYKNESVGK